MKNTANKRLLALLLAMACMLALLAGCGKKDGDDGKGGGSGSNGGTNSDYVYVASYKPLEGDFNYIHAAGVYGSKMYINSSVEVSIDDEGNVLSRDDEDYYTYYKETPILCCIDMETGTTEQLPNYSAAEIPEGYQGYNNVNSLCVDKDGNIWVVEYLSTYYFDAPEGVTPEDDDYYNYYVEGEDTYTVRKLDNTGAELLTLDLGAVQEAAEKSMGNLSEEEMMWRNSFYVQYFDIDDAGNLYVCTDMSVYVLDPNGELLFSIELDEWIQNIVKLADGTIAISSYDEGGEFMKRIDVAAKGLGDEKLEKGYNCYRMYPGGGDYLFYSGNDNTIFGYNAKTGENEKLINWLNADVNGENLNTVVPLEDGRILAMESSYDYESDMGGWTHNLITLTKTPASEVPQKIQLTYACNYLNYQVRAKILNFNKTNEKYRIEVLDYSEYNTEEDYNAGLTKLTTEIISGNVPDMMSTSGLPIAKYAAKGLLEDLYPYLDSDSELGRDKIVPSVLAALETEGKLYQITDSFTVASIVGDASKVGSETGWTLDEMKAVMDEMPEGMDVFESTTTRDEVLSMACSFSIDDFVNWQTGECSFDSEGFVKILEFANSFRKDFDWDNYEWSEEDSTPDRIMSGKQLLANVFLSDFGDFQMYDAMFNNNIVFKGFPCEGRNGNALNFYNGIVMTNSCKDKEGAWEFMRTILLEENQSGNDVWNFPTNQAAFDKKLEKAMTPEYEIDPETGEPMIDPETGEKVEVSQGGYGWGSLMIDIYAIKQEQADKIVNVINSINNVYSYDEDIMNIIQEEAAAYFNGDKSAQQVADLVQSRAKIYVNEQR